VGGRIGATMNRRRVIIAVFVVTIGLYFGVTWFFFGSPHPCGILEARQKPHAIRAAHESWFAVLKNWSGVMKETGYDSSVVVDAATKHITTRSQQQKEDIEEMHWRIWQKTPAQCLWEALTWQESAARAQDY
jgi:hypothetical protein